MALVAVFVAAAAARVAAAQAPSRLQARYPTLPGGGGGPTGQLQDYRSRGEGQSPQQPPTPAGIRIGPLVLWPTVRTGVSATGNVTLLFFVKALVVLPDCTKAALAIAREATERAASHSHSPGVTSTVRFAACQEREPDFAYQGAVGKLTGFPFGIVLARSPACISMELWIDGRATPIRRLVLFSRRSF